MDLQSMKPFVDLVTWLLEKDIRAKNAVSVLLALVTVVFVYLASAGANWRRDLDNRPLGLSVALAIIFLMSFLVFSLFASAMISRKDRHAKQRRQGELLEQKKRHIRRTLESLTAWQRGFVLRYLVERTTQIPEFRVGAYRATWDYEMEMLVQKGVVREHRRAGVYEIDPQYHDYLLDHWDPVTGTLS
jgi:hypothetical protein